MNPDMSAERNQVSIVIPVWNAAAYLPELLPCLLDQPEPGVKEILLLDSSSTDDTVAIASGFNRVRVIPEENFSHGGTRNRGIQLASSDLVVLMTQDALPRDEQWLPALTTAMEDPNVAYAFSRQVPRDDAPVLETYYLEQKFPEAPARRYEFTGEPLSEPEQVFCSNVSAIIRKSAWEECPFRDDLIMGEDQILSRDLQQAGGVVQYVPESVVVHSHRYSLRQIFQRYFDSVIALRQTFPDRDLNANAGSGIRYLKKECRALCRRHPLLLGYYPFYLGAKTAATVLAHYHERLPRGLCRACGMNKSYWDETCPPEEARK